MRKLTMSELNRLSIEEFKSAEKSPVVLVLDNIRSQNNVGSVFRTADAFLAEEIILCGITATPPHREIHKTALGATESVRWRYFEQTREALTELRSKGYRIIAVEQTDASIPLQDFLPPEGKKLALLFGNEVNGIDEQLLELADLSIEIPQSGTKHSINISVAVGIVLWDILNRGKKLINKCNPS
jgi:23S rRNA (guanosine2251-2'-O)-methyltransferase